jgi:DNA-binding transcriptional LysR family regulator
MFSDTGGDFNSHNSSKRLPSLQALRCFEAAARLENFSQAAQELHLTHGAISRAVRVLEEDLGIALFERRSRRVFLTDAGRHLAQAVHEGMERMRQATQDLRARAQHAQRWVLSCEPTLLMRWLIPRWPQFQEQHPQLQLHLVAGGGPFSFGDGIDLAIRRDDFPLPADCHVETLFIERIGPVCRPDRLAQWYEHPALGNAPGLRPEAPRLHSRTRPGAWTTWSDCSGQPQPSGPELRFDHFYFSLQAAVAGLGLAIGPWQLVRDDIASGVLAAPTGFVEDGSRYCLLSPAPPAAGSIPAQLLGWLRSQG